MILIKVFAAPRKARGLAALRAYNPCSSGDWYIGNTAVSKTAARGSTPRFPVRAPTASAARRRAHSTRAR